MNIIQEFFAGVHWQSGAATLFRVAVILFSAWIILKILKGFLEHLERKLVRKSQKEGEPPTESKKRIETITGLVRQGLLIALWITIGLMLLKEFGVEIGPLIASAGVIGLAVGFEAQSLVKDVISGFFIILENQIRVNDVAIINGTGGLVEKINFRTTVLRDLSGVIHIFPNGTITSLSNMTKEWSAYVFDIGVAYKENTDIVLAVMEHVGVTMMDDPAFGPLMLEPPELFGVDGFGDSAVIIKGRIKTKPVQQWTVGREYLRRIKHAFDEHHIEIPFPHRSIYMAEQSQPVAVKLFEHHIAGGA